MQPQRVSANPTKAFFVHTITRDIKLEDCILDLVDNSLDGARTELGNPVPSLSDNVSFAKFQIDVDFDESQFAITDNCGGISLNDAVNYAFTFGRRDNADPDDYSIGVYGIGMKRAVFKMGNRISIRSTRRQEKNSAEEPFDVKIDVASWLQDPVWDFDLEESEALSKPGVKILVDELREAISAEFSSPTFEVTLRRILSRDYARFIARGLIIRVNGTKVKPFEFALLQSEVIRPFHGNFMLKGVKIELIAGMAAAPSDNQDPDADSENEDRSGWYILCNDRMVVAADKTDLTGWGFGGKNRWHPQYRGFIGIIMFSATAADQLPLTTTKRSIDKDHSIYKMALGRMMELTKEWVDYTNKRKSSLDEAKVAEKSANRVSAFAANESLSMKFPALSKVSPKTVDVTIQYTKLQRLVRNLAAKLGNPNMSAREVGSKSFDYAYKEIVGEEV